MKKTKKVLWGLLITMILMGCSIDDPEIESSEDTLKEFISQKGAFPGDGIPDTGETPIPENEEDEEAISPDDDETDEVDSDENGDPIEVFISNS